MGAEGDIMASHYPCVIPGRGHRKSGSRASPGPSLRSSAKSSGERCCKTTGPRTSTRLSQILTFWLLADAPGSVVSVSPAASCQPARRQSCRTRSTIRRNTSPVSSDGTLQHRGSAALSRRSAETESLCHRDGYRWLRRYSATFAKRGHPCALRTEESGKPYL